MKTEAIAIIRKAAGQRQFKTLENNLQEIIQRPLRIVL